MLCSCEMYASSFLSGGQSFLEDPVIVGIKMEFVEPVIALDRVPDLQWNHPTLWPLPDLNLKRVVRWLKSKKRSSRQMMKTDHFACPHKRWTKEWKIIGEIGRVGVL